MEKFHQELEEFIFNDCVHKDDIDYALSKSSSTIDDLDNILSLSVQNIYQENDPNFEDKELGNITTTSDEKNENTSQNSLNKDVGQLAVNDLYYQRAVLTSLFVNENPNICWKSLRHHKADNPIYEGMFVIGIETPFGIATFHYSVDKYWGLFCVQELPCAPKWDGHTPEESIERLKLFSESIGM